MLQILKLSSACAISLAACASSTSASSAPVVLDRHEEEMALGDGIAPTEYHGIAGLFVAYDTWRQILVRIELDKRDIEVALARSVTMEKIATEEAAAMRKSAAMNMWRATYGPWLGFAGGLTVSAIVATVLGLVLR